MYEQGKSLRAWDSGKKIRCGEESWKGGEEGGALQLLQEVRSDRSERRSVLLSRAHASPRLTVGRPRVDGVRRETRTSLERFFPWGPEI